MTKRAFCNIRADPHYRRQAFVGGLVRAGYTVSERDFSPAPGDVLVTWNLSGSMGEHATRWAREGGTVIVAENGYLGHDAAGVQYYALALNGHNGSGIWPDGGGERFARLGIEVKPWRERGDHIIIRGQRGIGSPEMASPPDWHRFASRDLMRLSPRRQVIQEHGGKPANDAGQAKLLIESLVGCHAICIWASSAGVRALVEGVPVFYAAPHWICEGAAVKGVGNVERPKLDDAARAQALARMAWAQWSIAEIDSGEPFVRLVDLAVGF